MQKSSLSPLSYLNEISYSYWKAQVLFVAVDMDMFTLTAGNGKSCKAIAKKLRTDLRATEMILNALVSLEFLRKIKEVYRNTDISNRYLVKGSPLYQGDRIHHFHNMLDYWSKLSDAVKTGKPTAYDDAEEKVDEKRLREFIRAMHNIGVVQAGEIRKKLNLKKYYSLLDLAGGQGTYAVRFAKENPKLKAVVFDLPEVIKITREHIKESGMKGKVTAKAGDCLKDSFGKGMYDIVFVSNLLHIYKPVENRKILKKCWDSLLKKGIVVVQEFVLNSAKTQPLFGSLFSLNMLMGTHRGSSYSYVEMKEWLKDVGFKNVKRVDLDLDSGLVIGHKS
ncbi:MAG: 3-hydroxy-5-methyl-1-naphthoate 3-O-methyltransferase [Candidatus Scalindua arabica]|uniref:3-hydroxy-5-methyl-1-naphthoate 3-O-methyltransferase n=1 Tax=Candidatus Scalindua arabica TaxID=1127984 RepID=A0A941W551_9BACT|nr:3-hydroxy-5-methyl-1-naphthoate 3-O-methyltransferase [Candidatus Scalindua arabica]